jgi:hypothetical protein
MPPQHRRHRLFARAVVGDPPADLLRLYLRRIDRVPLLTAGQEVELAKRIERRDAAARARWPQRVPRVTPGASRLLRVSALP